MSNKIAIVSACAHRLYLYRPELFDSLREEGFEVTVMGPEPQSLGDEWLKKEGIPYIGLPLERRGVDPLAERRASSVITNTVKKEGIGLVFSYGIRFAPLANNSARRAGVPCMNVINGLGNLFIADGAAGAVKRAAILPYIGASLGYSSAIVFQNRDDREVFRSMRLGRESCYMSVRGSGVNTSRFPVLPLPEERVFGFLSRMNPEKGICELVSAFKTVLKDYPDAKLLLAGEQDGISPSCQAELDGLIEQGSAEYLGEISDVISFYRRIRYFVFPSYREGTPRVSLEAASCGRPVITTDAVGCRETVRDGYNGLLVTPRDSGTLAGAMLRFCAEPELAERMGRNARGFIEDNFDVYSVNAELIKKIKEICRI